MRNLGRIKKAKAATPATGVPQHQQWQGWEDYRLGRDYPREYETWSPPHQRNYERGRACAATLVGAGVTLFPWPRNRRLGHLIEAKAGWPAVETVADACRVFNIGRRG
jgi:hypothetical protein